MVKNKWYVVTRDTRYSERGKQTTSQKSIITKQDNSLTVRKATKEEIVNRKRDSSRTAPYQVLVEKGRVVL